jgi:ABC-type arginine/histidine transport system permease subunit
MPQIFKALATITAWTLFFLGWLMLVFVFVFMAIMPFEPETWEPWGAFDTAWMLAVITLILSICAMKLRKSLE